MTQIRAKGSLDARYWHDCPRSEEQKDWWRMEMKESCVFLFQPGAEAVHRRSWMSRFCLRDDQSLCLQIPFISLLMIYHLKIVTRIQQPKGPEPPLYVVLWMLEVLQIVIWMSKSKQQRCNCFMILSFVPSSGNESMFF